MQTALKKGPSTMNKPPRTRSEAMPPSGWNTAEVMDAIEASPLARVRERESFSISKGRMGAKKLP